MLSNVGLALSNLISWIGSVITSLTEGSMSALLPLVTLSVAIGIVGYGIRTIKSLCWGI